MPRDERGSAPVDGRPAAPAEVELAAHRNRLEEKLAAQRATAMTRAAPGQPVAETRVPLAGVARVRQRLAQPCGWPAT